MRVRRDLTGANAANTRNGFSPTRTSAAMTKTISRSHGDIAAMLRSSEGLLRKG